LPRRQPEKRPPRFQAAFPIVFPFTAMTATALIAFGSNLENPAEQVRRAIAAVAALPVIRSLQASSLYLSAPVGYADQPDFVNAVALVEADCGARKLLHLLQDIETRFGRVRSFRNAPRTLDLDLIDFAGSTSDDAELTLPHPRAHQRSFVMLPLAEIAPDYPIGSHGRARDLVQALGSTGIEKLGAAAAKSAAENR
jgi:2-amino-4-hydroxy-6-hydroxymethyldihydropteridine diphosphokinase